MVETTVVVPVYNVELYLRECLDSILNQTRSNLQIICVDDGSTDSSPEILREYAQKDHRIQIVTQANAGLSAARNNAYELIQGKYTLFVDSDDKIHEDLCQRSIEHIETRDADFVCFYHQKFPKRHDDGNYAFADWPVGDVATIEGKKRILNYCYAWSKLWRTSFLLENKLLFPLGLVYEDNPHHWRSVLLAERIGILPERLYYYRIRPKSLCQSRTAHLMDIIPIYQKVRQELLESDNYETYRNEFLLRKFDLLYRHYWNIADPHKEEMAEQIRSVLNEDEVRFLSQYHNDLPEKQREFFLAIHNKSRLSPPSFFFRTRRYVGTIIDRCRR
ncbi:glycosyltransferase family 2 protein [Bremerella sp. JC770]|uniref:glycosyltransferase family 2 protein n=1 Tax=Bremerella sp. JC770 TaxID=3232137 RepID=UPI00345AB256